MPPRRGGGGDETNLDKNWLAVTTQCRLDELASFFKLRWAEPFLSKKTAKEIHGVCARLLRVARVAGSDQVPRRVIAESRLRLDVIEYNGVFRELAHAVSA